MTWRKIGSGSFNTVYRNTTDDYYKQFVFKVLKNPRATTDLPERSIHLWNLINPTRLQAQIHEDPQLGRGWLAPFIQGVQASDEEISLALIEIYQRTGRIVIDALSPENFIRTEDRQTICIDIGMALQLEPLHQKASSPTSVYTWMDLHHDYNHYFLQGRVNYPQTVATIKALLYIKLNPELFKEPESTLKTLEQSSEQRFLFAENYDQQHQQQGSLQLRHLTAHPLQSEIPFIEPLKPAPFFSTAAATQAPPVFFHSKIQPRILPARIFPPRINPFPTLNGALSARINPFSTLNGALPARINPFPTFNGALPARVNPQLFTGSFFFNPTDPISLAQAYRFK